MCPPHMSMPRRIETPRQREYSNARGRVASIPLLRKIQRFLPDYTNFCFNVIDQ